MEKKYLPDGINPLGNPQIDIHLMDGRTFIKDNKSRNYDVIILNVPNPGKYGTSTWTLIFKRI